MTFRSITRPLTRPLSRTPLRSDVQTSVIPQDGLIFEVDAANLTYTESAGALTTITDKAGSLVLTARNTPILDAGAINGKDAIYLDGTEYFEYASATADEFLNGDDGCTVFIVAKGDSGAIGSLLTYFDAAETSNDRLLQITYDDANALGDAFIRMQPADIQRFCNPDVALAQNDLNLFVFQVQRGQTPDYFVNDVEGTMSGALVDHAFSTPNGPVIRLGTYNSGFQRFKGWLCHVLVYNNGLMTTAEIEEVAQALDARWAINSFDGIFDGSFD